MTALRIAANDPALASALTRSAVRRDTARHVASLRRTLPRQPTVRKMQKALRNSLGPRILWENIKRRDGSRAYAEWFLLTGCDDGSISVSVIQVCARTGVDTYSTTISFSAHSVARLVQRTVAAVDFDAIIPLLKTHALLAALRIGRVASDVGFETVTPEGVFLWAREDGDAIAATWIDARTAVDPTLRARCAAVANARVAA